VDIQGKVCVRTNDGMSSNCAYDEKLHLGEVCTVSILWAASHLVFQYKRDNQSSIRGLRQT